MSGLITCYQYLSGMGEFLLSGKLDADLDQLLVNSGRDTFGARPGAAALSLPHRPKEAANFCKLSFTNLMALYALQGCSQVKWF